MLTDVEETGRHGRIVVGIDGSNDANVALAWAASEAFLRHAELCVVHAWILPMAESPIAVPMVVDEGEAERHARELLDATVDGVLATVGARPEIVEKILVQGGAAPSLLDVAKEADLLVVGSRGRGGFGELLLGSVSHQLAHHASCPLVIVRAPDR